MKEGKDVTGVNEMYLDKPVDDYEKAIAMVPPRLLSPWNSCFVPVSQPLRTQLFPRSIIRVYCERARASRITRIRQPLSDHWFAFAA